MAGEVRAFVMGQTRDARTSGGQTWWENFSGWWSAWHDNLVTRDYALLDRILPDRARDLEKWMHKTKYDGRFRPILKDLSNRRADVLPGSAQHRDVHE